MSRRKLYAIIIISFDSPARLTTGNSRCPPAALCENPRPPSRCTAARTQSGRLRHRGRRRPRRKERLLRQTGAKLASLRSLSPSLAVEDIYPLSVSPFRGLLMREFLSLVLRRLFRPPRVRMTDGRTMPALRQFLHCNKKSPLTCPCPWRCASGGAEEKGATCNSVTFASRARLLHSSPTSQHI